MQKGGCLDPAKNGTGLPGTTIRYSDFRGDRFGKQSNLLYLSAKASSSV